MTSTDNQPTAAPRGITAAPGVQPEQEPASAPTLNVDKAIAELRRFEEIDRAAVGRGESPDWWERGAEPAPAPTLADDVAALRTEVVHYGNVSTAMGLADALGLKLEAKQFSGEVKAAHDAITARLDQSREISAAGGVLMRQIRATPLPTAPCSRCAGLAVELAGTRQMLDVMTAPESGPVVLSLPQPTPGAVGYVGEMSGHRWSPTEFGRFVDETTGQVSGWLQMLEREGSVTVVSAAPREPQTWTFSPDQVDALKALIGLVHRDELAEAWWQSLPEEVREVLDGR